MFSARTDKRPRLCAYWCYTGPIVGSCDDMIVDGWFTNVYYMILYIYIYLYIYESISIVCFSRIREDVKIVLEQPSSSWAFKLPKMLQVSKKWNLWLA